MMKLKTIRIQVLCMLLFTLFANTASATDFKVSMIIADKNTETLAGGFHTKITPGSKHTYTVTVTNHSKENESVFYLYPADVVPKLNGGKNFRDYGETVSGPAKWIKTKPEKIILQPLEAKNFSFNIEYPKDLSYGQYISYIALQEYKEPEVVKSKSQEVTFQTDALTKIGIQIIGDYNSDQANSKFSFSDFEYEYLSNGLLSVSPHVENGGNILGKPDIEMKLIDLDTNQNIYESSLSMDSVYANTEAKTDFILKDTFLEQGNYKAVLVGEWEDQRFSREFEFTLNQEEVTTSQRTLADNNIIKIVTQKNDTQVILLTAILGFIVMLLLIILLFKKSKRKSERGDEYVTSKETLEATKN